MLGQLPYDSSGERHPVRFAADRKLLPEEGVTGTHGSDGG